MIDPYDIRVLRSAKREVDTHDDDLSRGIAHGIQLAADILGIDLEADE